MNKKLNKKSYGVIAIVMMFLVVAFSVPSTSAYIIDDCSVTLTSTIDWRTLEFNAFLDLHFASKKNNTYLISDAIKAFVEYKKSVLKAMQEYEVGVAATITQSEQITACMKIADKKIAEAKQMLVEHVKNTSGVKHGQIMLEKYRTINSKLSELNVELGKFSGAFEGFYNKFPGYSTDCLTNQ